MTKLVGPKIAFLCWDLKNLSTSQKRGISDEQNYACYNTGLTEKFLRSYGRTQMNFKKEKYLFMFGCTGFSLLPVGFL